MSEIKFKKPRRKIERKTTAEDSDEDKSDDESLKLVLLVHVTIKTTTFRSCIWRPHSLDHNCMHLDRCAVMHSVHHYYCTQQAN